MWELSTGSQSEEDRQWDDEASLRDFRARAEKWLQQETYHSLWHKCHSNIGNEARVRIAHTLFHTPEIRGEMQYVVDTLRTRTAAEMRIVEKSLEAIKSIQEKMHAGSRVELSSIPIALLTEHHEVKVHFVRFRFDRGSLKGLSPTYFLDHFGRVYEEFDDFMRCNRLPSGYAVYPTDAYMKKFDYGWTPTCNDKKWKIVDFLAVLSGVGATVVALFVALNPVGLVMVSGVGIICAGWSACRSARELRDRKLHHQSISNMESMPLWISAVGGVAAAAAAVPTIAAVLTGEQFLQVCASGSRVAATCGAATFAAAGSYASVGDGRLELQDEVRFIAIFAYLIFRFYNVMMTNDEANLVHLIMEREGTFDKLSQVEDPMKWQKAILEAIGMKLLALGLPINLRGSVRNLLSSTDFQEFKANLFQQGKEVMLALTSTPTIEGQR